MWILSILAAYLITGLIIHHWILPAKMPDYNDYFKVGKSFESRLEGITQTIVKVGNEYLATELVLHARAAGPPIHTHEKFDETFTVKSGTLSMQYGSEIKRIGAGQTIVIPKNIPHRPYNETDSIVEVTGEIPIDFAYCLSQLYPLWDENEANAKPPKILFQLAVFGDKFDSYPIVNAPPKPVFKAIKFLLAPTARLIGYTSYNENYKPK